MNRYDAEVKRCQLRVEYLEKELAYHQRAAERALAAKNAVTVDLTECYLLDVEKARLELALAEIDLEQAKEKP